MNWKKQANILVPEMKPKIQDVFLGHVLWPIIMFFSVFCCFVCLLHSVLSVCLFVFISNIKAFFMTQIYQINFST